MRLADLQVDIRRILKILEADQDGEEEEPDDAQGTRRLGKPREARYQERRAGQRADAEPESAG